MSLSNKLLMTVGSSDKLYVDDVFSTWLYNGNGATQTINNGIDLSGNGGMVWIKGRSPTSSHRLYDTARSASSLLATDATAAAVVGGGGNIITSFDSAGFTLPNNAGNTSGQIYTSWTFRNASKFFTHLTISHTNGASTNINLSELGTVGMVVAKITNTTGEWTTWHRNLTIGNNLQMNSVVTQTGINAWLSVSGTTAILASTAPTGTYIIYAWAHDTSADGMVQCGTYTGGTVGTLVNLGWEPQFVLIKAASGELPHHWHTFDSMRGLAKTTGSSYKLSPNITDAESPNVSDIYPESNGFSLPQTGSSINGSGYSYVYLAIRIPNKPPTNGTEVFQPVTYTGTNTDNRLVNTGIKTDLALFRQRNGSGTGYEGFVVGDRLRGQPWLKTGSGQQETALADGLDQQSVNATEYGTAFSSMVGVFVGNNTGNIGTSTNINANTTSSFHIVEAFRRAPGFMDIVCYTGTATNMAVSHQLGVAPELMIFKSRGSSQSWPVYFGDNTSALLLNLSDAKTSASSVLWNSTHPTDTSFTLGAWPVHNTSTIPHVAYLFASLPGISKVGSYTGNGTSQTIDCGFTTGTRFVLLKRTESAGNWFVMDTARGIVAGNDPFLRANLTTAEDGTYDLVDTDNSGFIVNQESVQNLNVIGATYIYLAIA